MSTPETDIISALNGDSTLDSLIGANGSTKIFPVFSPITKTGSSNPFIVYSTTNNGTLDENWLIFTIEFDSVSDSYLESKNIKDRLQVLLDVEHEIRSFVTSATYRFYYMKLFGGSDSIDTDTRLYHTVSSYQVIYNTLT